VGTNTTNRLFRFGVFEADEQTGELRKQGRRLLLQDQPFQVLLMLLERPGKLIARGEIQERLWPDGTFVDFDQSLNTAINKVREALGDSAASPRFIETLARRGYRFIAPVEVVEGKSAAIAPANPPPQQAPVPVMPEPVAPERMAAPVDPLPGLAQRVLTSPEEMPQASRPLVRTLFLLLQVMYLCFYVIALDRLSIVEEIVGGMVSHALWAVVLLIITAVVGIPTRLYLISAAAFNAPGLRGKFLRVFPMIFPLDELWALAPFLLLNQIGYGLALGVTAALLYVPFAQRSLILMGAGAPARRERSGQSDRS
jgi:DNA-binding winged helix-turn-helix (wHTH) protein